jgi:hypothetical protein
MPVKFIYNPYIAAAVNKANEQVHHYAPHWFYNPAMANQVGNSQYLMSQSNIPRQPEQKLNFLA